MFSKLIALSLLATLSSANSTAFASQSRNQMIFVSVPDQKLAVFENGTKIIEYPVSTSRYGLGDRRGSYATPVGRMMVVEKVGQGAPVGAVFKNRQPTGEVIKPNARGRDPIITRILCLKGLDDATRNALDRRIYIHGTPVESMIGKPVSYGCIRMRSKDVVALFQRVNLGTPVNVSNTSLSRTIGVESVASLSN
jgi:lipoprotein-anchoring transpeptidase ErfK/SrfK